MIDYDKRYYNIKNKKRCKDKGQSRFIYLIIVKCVWLFPWAFFKLKKDNHVKIKKGSVDYLD